eukprot:CAMPEP_0196826120 /NCGR_PEP_ID=MMETSP1362-20130617/93449_1 /TAXON_ID=163516 /ORGANISM="Leptocylindrus danicus, Strain CCMP1856" /LENGTH=251 /DNA_ID=CAMNT_0042206661 /DNA_START=322 /DNA_END=1080 /DNA_ORIENTATION=-
MEDQDKGRVMYDFDSLYMPDWHQPNHLMNYSALPSMQCEYDQTPTTNQILYHAHRSASRPDFVAEQESPAILTAKKGVQWTSITINALYDVPMSSQMDDDERCSLWWQPDEIMEFKNSKRREDSIEQRRKQAMLRYNGVKRVLREQKKLADRSIVFDPDAISVAIGEFTRVAHDRALQRANELTLSLCNGKVRDEDDLLAFIEYPPISATTLKRKRSCTRIDVGLSSRREFTPSTIDAARGVIPRTTLPFP